MTGRQLLALTITIPLLIQDSAGNAGAAQTTDGCSARPRQGTCGAIGRVAVELTGLGAATSVNGG